MVLTTSPAAVYFGCHLYTLVWVFFHGNDVRVVQMACGCLQVYILPLGGPVSIQRHAGLIEGVWLGAGPQLRHRRNGLGQSRRHIYRTKPTGTTISHAILRVSRNYLAVCIHTRIQICICINASAHTLANFIT